MKVIGFIGAVFTFVFFANLAYAADMSIDMLPSYIVDPCQTLPERSQHHIHARALLGAICDRHRLRVRAPDSYPSAPPAPFCSPFNHMSSLTPSSLSISAAPAEATIATAAAAPTPKASVFVY